MTSYMISTGKLTRAIAAGLALSWMAGMVMAQETTPTPFVEDAGVRVKARLVRWVDDHRVIFHRFDGETADGRWSGAIALWDTRNGQVNVHRQAPVRAGNLCFDIATGIMHFYIAKTPERDYVYMMGPLGEERRIIDDGSDGKVMNHMGCGRRRKPDGLADHHMYFLRKDFGILDHGGRERQRQYPKMPIIFRPAGGGNVIEMPFDSDQMISRCSRYQRYRDEYLISRCGSARNVMDGACHMVWWLGCDGQATRECLPMDGLGIAWTRLGWVIAHRREDLQGNLWDSGLYLFPPGRPRKLLVSGFIDDIDGSPDGCKVAFSHDPKPTLDGTPLHQRWRLRAIDVCADYETIMKQPSKPRG